MLQYLLMALFCAGAVAIDQLSKAWVVNHIPPDIPVWDGVFHLTFTKNTGAAFSSLEGQQWLFALVMVLFIAFIIWEFPKKRLEFTTVERWMIVSVFAGGVGNMIDRLRLGYVIDMVEVEFMNFAVFNVADIFITCGCIFLVAHLILFNKAFWKEEKK